MRFIIMHKTNAHWESGAIPSPELIARVGALLGELAKAGVLVSAEGLRASSEGVRLRFSGGTRTVINGSLRGRQRAARRLQHRARRSIEEAIEWASRQAEALGDSEIRHPAGDRTVGHRHGAQAGRLTTRRYMVLRKATAATESGAGAVDEQRAELSRLIDETTRTSVHLATETMRPEREG